MTDEERIRESSSAWSITGPLSLESMTDVKHPLFEARKAAGELINSPMSRVQYNCSGRSSAYHGATTMYMWL